MLPLAQFVGREAARYPVGATRRTEARRPRRERGTSGSRLLAAVAALRGARRSAGSRRRQVPARS
jgi:hypothetical protein